MACAVLAGVVAVRAVADVLPTGAAHADAAARHPTVTAHAASLVTLTFTISPRWPLPARQHT
jgi:hypothetical protein